MFDADREALEYHAGGGRPGKIEIRSTKPMATQLDLSLAYTPGVAAPCRVIAEDTDRAYDYTARGNLVAVVTNGTAVLGLGDIGPEASKPVMEGKAVLFKHFAGIDVFDLELNADAETVIQVVKALEPTFGGINLEDIKAPDCFTIEAALRESMSIPVFHDDQHGTAIIAAAAFLNAVEITGKRIEDIRLVVSGAGAAAIACTNLIVDLGLRRENILMCDSRGVLRTGREITDPFKAQFVVDTDRENLADALVEADAFLGLSVGGVVSKEMVASMAENPIIFAMANPDPEISWPDATSTRPDAVMATGRSDYPNQVNNVLGFPYIFRGALDVRATTVTREMKLAAVEALAQLAREPVPTAVTRAYGDRKFQFGRDYIIPTPFDPRVLVWVAPAVAKAAMASGVARKPIEDWAAYTVALERHMDPGRGLLKEVIREAQREPQRIVLAEGNDPRIVKAASVLAGEEIARPVLLGMRDDIEAVASEIGVDLEGVEVVFPSQSPSFEAYVSAYLEVNQRRGVTPATARADMARRTNFGMMMVQSGDVDGIVVGATRPYAEAIRPALRVVGTEGRACGLTTVLTREETLFFADTTVNVDPDAETLAEITALVVGHVRSYGIEPRVAMLSFANFGSVRHDDTRKMAKAAKLVRQRIPGLMIEGEVQVDIAWDMAMRQRFFPWSKLTKRANTFIFPNLASANITYKMLHQVAGLSVFGPILLGMKRPIGVLPLDTDASNIVNVAASTAVEAQRRGNLG